MNQMNIERIRHTSLKSPSKGPRIILNQSKKSSTDEANSFQAKESDKSTCYEMPSKVAA